MLGASEGRDKPLDHDAVHPHGSCPVGLILTAEKCRVTGQGSITPRGALECRAVTVVAILIAQGQAPLLKSCNYQASKFDIRQLQFVAVHAAFACQARTWCLCAFNASVISPRKY